MISTLRSAVGSWAIKILFVLLIASFAVWGIGDIFRGGGLDQRVGSVGSRSINLIEIDRVFQGQLDNLRRSFDPAIEPVTAIALGALDTAARQVVAGALVDEAAGDLNLRASDEAIALEIAQNPSLQGLDGQFDARIFRNILAANGLTEQDFLEQTRRDAARQQLLNATAGSIAAPDTLVDVVFAHANERRQAQFIHLLADDQAEVPEPTADALNAYFTENSDAYQAPEYRRLAILTLRPE
ncbi:MAG: SurA N-terminal domain-containing protein, partial [Pseudomonadota bacterium]